MVRYPLATSPWSVTKSFLGVGTDESFAVDTILHSGFTTMGEETKQYEEELCKQFGSKYAVTCNSGSSANLLMTAAQFFRSDEKRLKRGDEIIVPALGWSTSYSPLLQYGLKLRFIDVNPYDLCINTHIVEDAIRTKTRAILAVDLLGHPCDYGVYGNPCGHKSLHKICNDNDLILLEDSCEAMGAKIAGKWIGTFGECGTFSTFFSHHISTMEGGIVLTDNEELYHIMLSLRSHGWTRGQPKNSKFYVADDKAWEFVLPGYNVRPLEVCSAIGRVQLAKLDDFLVYRRKNADVFNRLFSDIEDVRILKPSSGSSYFGFAFILRGKLVDQRDYLEKWFKDHNIETRPIICGNFLKHSTIMHYNYKVHKDILVANEADNCGIMIGNHNTDVSKGLEYVFDTLVSFLEKV